MIKLTGLIVAFIGFLLLLMSRMVKSNTIFQAEIILGFPLVLFGLNVLMD